MELPIVITVLLTMVSPFINAYINKVTWSPKTKNVVALAVSLVIAVLYLVFSGTIADWSQLAIVVPMVYTLQQLIYTFFLKNIATKFEAITTVGSVVVSPSQTDAGKVDITSDATINSPSGDAVEVDPPVQLITTEAPAEPAKPVSITKEENVVG